MYDYCTDSMGIQSTNTFHIFTYFTDKMDIFGFGMLRWIQINTKSAAEPSNLSLENVRNIFIFLLLFSLPFFWWRAWGSDKYKIMN